MQLPTSYQINLCPIEAPFGKIVGNVQSFVIKIIINCNFPCAVISLILGKQYWLNDNHVEFDLHDMLNKPTNLE